MILATVAALLVLLATAGLVVVCRRGGGDAWRVACVVAAGVLLAGCLLAVPGHWAATHWVGGADVGIASAVVAFLLVLGLPLSVLCRAGLPSSVQRAVASRGGQLLLHPLVGAAVNTAVLILVFSSGWYDRAVGGGLSWVLLLLLVVVCGAWGCAALMDPELVQLASGARLLFAVLVSALNQLPGVMAINGGHTMQGGAMWLVAAPMVIPLLYVVVTRWMQSDARRAAEIDAQIDAWEQQRRQW